MPKPSQESEIQFSAVDDDGNVLFYVDSLGNRIILDTIKIESDTIKLDVPPGTTPNITVRKIKKK